MGLLTSFGVVTAAAAATGTAWATAAAAGDMDFWMIVEKGGFPMAVVFALGLFEVTRRYDAANRTIAIKDATILEMAQRQTIAMEAANSIGRDQIEIAHNTERLLTQLVVLHSGKVV